MIVATGASQFEFLEHLTADKTLDWSKVVAFHLDEYVGLPVTHPASFRKYLRERFLEKLPCPIGAFHEVDGENDPVAECARLNALIAQHDIDICCLGIGENSHIAFNDPPADFETEEPFIVVDLNQTCRQQQVNEGWFATTDDVPKQAISMSVKQIMRSRMLVNSVPGERKAKAVRWTLEKDISPDYPATIMRNHPKCYLNLDRDSAAQVRFTRYLSFCLSGLVLIGICLANALPNLSSGNILLAIAGVLFFLGFCGFPPMVSIALSVLSKKPFSHIILATSSLLYGAWFADVYYDAFYLHLDPQSAIALIFVGVYFLPVLGPLWLAVLVNEFWRKK